MLGSNFLRERVNCRKEGSQEQEALLQINDKGSRLFWKDFKAVVREYPELDQVLRKEYQIVRKMENFEGKSHW